MLKKVAFDASLWRTEQEIQYQARLLALCIAEGAHEDLDFFDPEDKNFVPKLVRRIATGRGSVVVVELDKAVMNFRDGWYVSRGKTEKLWLDDDYDQLPPDAKPCLVTAGVLSRKPTGRVDDEFCKDFAEALKLATRIFEETGLLKKPKPSKGEEANEESRESKAGSKTKAKPKSEDTDKGTDEDAGTEGNGEETAEETEGAGEEADPETENDAATEDNADETESQSYRSISSGYPDPYIVELKADLRKWYNSATPGGINQHLSNLHNRRERAQLEVEKADMVIKALLGCLQASSKDLVKLLEEAEWQEDARNSLRGRVLLSLSKFYDVVQVNNEYIENMAEHTKYLLELRNLHEKTAEEENEKAQPNSQEKGKPVDMVKKPRRKPLRSRKLKPVSPLQTAMPEPPSLTQTRLVSLIRVRLKKTLQLRVVLVKLRTAIQPSPEPAQQLQKIPILKRQLPKRLPQTSLARPTRPTREFQRKPLQLLILTTLKIFSSGVRKRTNRSVTVWRSCLTICTRRRLRTLSCVRTALIFSSKIIRP